MPIKRVRKKTKESHLKEFNGNMFIDTGVAPVWWASTPDQALKLLKSLKGVEVFQIGDSVGGKPIMAASWGKRDMLPGRTSTSLAGARSGLDSTAFYGKGKRERQHLLFLGGVHASELEGTVAMLNIINIFATGKDLLNRKLPELRELGKKLRVTIIPFLNIDGRLRSIQHRHLWGIDPVEHQIITQGLYKNGEKLKWPTSKLTNPLPVDELEVLGTYFNDNGVNLVYDDFCGADVQPETKALMAFCKDEMPDAVICSHSNAGSLISPPASYIPEHFRHRSTQIGTAVSWRCAQEGLSNKIDKTGNNYCGQCFYQTDAIHHCCGALPLLVEFPCGWQKKPKTLEGILDLSMTIISEIIRFGCHYGFRPPETQ